VADGTRFTYHKIRKILRGIRLGLSLADAAALVGISEPRVIAFRDNQTRFRDLIGWAEAQAVADRLAIVPAAWWLERRRNEEFGRRTADDAAIGQTRPDSPYATWKAAQSENGARRHEGARA